MTKAELIKELEQYDDDTEIFNNGECLMLLNVLEGRVVTDGIEKVSVYLQFEYED